MDDLKVLVFEVETLGLRVRTQSERFRVRGSGLKGLDFGLSG